MTSGRQLLLLLTVSLFGCAGRQIDRSVPSETWSLEERDEVRIEVVGALLERQRYDLALKAISELRGDGLDDLRLDLYQAEALTGQGLYAESIDLLERLKPRGGTERLKLLGLAYFGQGNLDGSVKSFTRAVRQSDRAKKPDLLNNLGFALASAGEHEEAIEVYTKALSLDPSLARTRNNMGFSLAALGRDKEAHASFKAAADNTGFDGKRAQAEAWYNLGVARRIREDDPGAREAWLGALDMNPDHAQARAALDTLNAAEEKP